MKTKWLIALLWVASLVVTAAATARAQLPEPSGLVIAGPDVGFRVNRYDADRPVGELVVKRDGQWVAVQFGATVKPIR
jgi:hypothetical protein